ncbi:hypothetical protein EYF80_001697 [Liparis tanakae]|uniref:Uncharacterized protein n=1 Tax=Liparis tanakae TaxID=230148 RepID=A0A4Z2JD08_9TELE|nr:hypothetical protein EYF80_001697 [Liparis tanakae]
MIIPGRDRYCRKVTRRRGNGLQPARFDERGGEKKKKDPEEDGERQRVDNQNEGKTNKEASTARWRMGTSRFPQSRCSRIARHAARPAFTGGIELEFEAHLTSFAMMRSAQRADQR